MESENDMREADHLSKIAKEINIKNVIDGYDSQYVETEQLKQAEKFRDQTKV